MRKPQQAMKMRARPTLADKWKKKKKEKKKAASGGGAGGGGGDNPSAGEKVPRSMVFARGKIGRTLRRLERDLRHMLMPFTATKLKESRRNTVKDFLAVAGPLGVTHWVVLSATSLAPYLRMARTPRGPTITFRVCSYSLAADVANAQTKPRVPPGIFESPPLVVMNGLTGGAAGAGSSSSEQQQQQQQALKLVSVMFQNLFPPIDVSTVKLSECKRVLLLHYDRESNTIELRHYAITARPTGVSRAIRRLVQSHQVPNLAGFADISEFVARGGYGSESEAEDEAGAGRVELPQRMGRANAAARQSCVRLHELGPRLSLQVVKVEEGLMSGAVMFHQFVKKTPKEVAEQKKLREEKEALKKQRREQQEENVWKKQQQKEQEKEEQRRRQKKPTARSEDGAEVDEDDDGGSGSGSEEDDDQTESRRQSGAGREDGGGDDKEDDDAEWYRQEVGEEPDEDQGFVISRGRGRGGIRRPSRGQGRGSGRGSETSGRGGGRFAAADGSGGPRRGALRGRGGRGDRGGRGAERGGRGGERGGRRKREGGFRDEGGGRGRGGNKRRKT